MNMPYFASRNHSRRASRAASYGRGAARLGRAGRGDDRPEQERHRRSTHDTVHEWDHRAGAK